MKGNAVRPFKEKIASTFPSSSLTWPVTQLVSASHVWVAELCVSEAGDALPKFGICQTNIDLAVTARMTSKLRCWRISLFTETLNQTRSSASQGAVTRSAQLDGAPFSFDGCVGSDLTGGWDIPCMKRFSSRGRTAAGWQYEHQHHICLNLYEVRLRPC